MFIEATSEIASRITGAIRDAARATGASFDYLLRTAQRESNLDPAAKASTSSATGLFQFTDQTWLHTLKVAGPDLGYGRYADAITTNSSGQYTVSDPALRREVMQLRHDPAAASAMAGAFTQRNAALLTEKIGRQPTQGELYIAHFLGAGGAVQLINAKANSPALRATDLFPAASSANPTIFHDVRGKPRSVQQVYDLLVAGHGAAKTGPVPIPAQDKVGPIDSGLFANAARPSGPLYPEARVARTSATETPVFHGLFHTGQRGPVSDFVSELWSAKSVQFPERRAMAAASPVGTEKASPGAMTQPLDLFQFLRPGIRSQDRSA